jgi:hypothetical protein
MAYGRVVYSRHAFLRMTRRGITEAEVAEVLANGEVIEDYPGDAPLPSYLLLGSPAGRLLHVVAADHANAEETFVITVYEPDPARWDAAFRRRRW